MSALKGERENFLVTPLHWQQLPMTLLVLYCVQDAVHEPELVVSPSVRPTVGSITS